MSFLSLDFWTFLVAVCVIYYAVPKKMQNIVLLTANIVFYASWNVAMTAIIIAEVLISYYAAVVMEKALDRDRKITLIITVIASLTVLFVTKYVNFTYGVVFDGLSMLGFAIEEQTFDIIVPLGISFFSFKVVSYLADVYSGKTLAEKSLVKYMLYVSFFPQIVSGPIERGEKFIPQLYNARYLYYTNISSGLKITLWGLFKKIVVADNIAIVVNNIYNNITLYDGIILWVGVFLFAIQLYCDFSGYSDMAVGIAKLLGFEDVKNFECPYLSENIKEFWARWHISLSSFFRDYIYIPLGGSRVPLYKRCINCLC